MIQPTINTHIDCSKNSKSVVSSFSKQQQGTLKVCCASFSVNYHTESNAAQHVVVTLTTYMTYLSLTDSWKGNTRYQFLSHFKEEHHLLDSLVPDTDMIPETVRITFPKMAVQKNHDLRQNHVLQSVQRSKTGSTEKSTSEVYYDLLWNAVYQHDLNNAAGHKKRQTFVSQQVDSFDESDHNHGEDTLSDQEEGDSCPYSIF